MKFVLMFRDELGDTRRAYGSEYLEDTYEFPAFDDSDSAMNNAFYTWRDTIEEKANNEWQSIFGEECRVFLEETYDSQFKRNYHFYGV